MTISENFKKYFYNTGWLFAEKSVYLLAGFIIGIFVARYLGPSDFGILNYAISFVLLFGMFASFGMDFIVVRELISRKEDRDKILGTAFLIKLAGAFIVIFLIYGMLQLLGNDQTTVLLVMVISGGLIFQSFFVIDFYYQSQVRSKRTAIVRIAVVIIIALAKLLLIWKGMPLVYFGAVIFLEYMLYGLGFLLMYRLDRLLPRNWKWDSIFAKKVIKNSFPIFLSAVAVVAYQRVDQIMIMEMLGADASGNYAAAVRLTQVWFFLPTIITMSLFPAILQIKKESFEKYKNNLRTLLSFMLLLALIICIPIALLSPQIIKYTFGSEYSQAAGVLFIYAWVTIFVFIGAVRGKWLIAENLHKFLAIFGLIGLAINIIMNLVLIPRIGINGAAIASLCSQLFSSYLLFGFFSKTREMFKIQNKAILKIFNFSDYYKLMKLKKQS